MRLMIEAETSRELPLGWPCGSRGPARVDVEVDIERRSLESRFEALVSSHRDRAVGLAWRLVGGDGAAAEDVAQEAFVKAHAGLGRFREESALETWLFRIVVRQAQSHLRWRRVRERFGQVEADRTADPRAEVGGDPFLRERIGRALTSLPRGQREAFVLVHMTGFSVREAAGIMGRAEGTVKSHLHRALQKLREQLADRVRPETSMTMTKRTMTNMSTNMATNVSKNTDTRTPTASAREEGDDGR
jgi:RNA polymerase sigma-70 factor (ECF subfamily)